MVTRCSISGVLKPVYCQMTVTTGMLIWGKDVGRHGDDGRAAQETGSAQLKRRRCREISTRTERCPYLDPGNYKTITFRLANENQNALTGWMNAETLLVVESRMRRRLFGAETVNAPAHLNKSSFARLLNCQAEHNAAATRLSIVRRFC